MEASPEGGQEGQAGAIDELTSPTSRRQRAFAAAEYLAAALVALWLSRPFWLPGRYVVAFDTVAYSAPNYAVTMESWRAGRLPLWNDLIFGGVVHLGNPQAGVLSPTKVIGLLFDTNRAMGVTVALHLVVMALGTVALLRRLGARPPAGFAAATVMVANGAMLTRAIQFEQIIVLAWLPLLLTTITVVLRAPCRSWSAMGATGAVTAMVLLAGHPQMAYQVVLVATVWAVALTVTGRTGVAGRTRDTEAAGRTGDTEVARCTGVDRARAGDLMIAIGGGVLAAALQLVAALAATADSAIGADRDLDALASPLLSTRPEYLLRVLFGTVRGGDQSWFAGGFESIGYVGVAAALVGVAGLVALVRHRPHRPIGVALVALAVMGVVWSLGPRTPLFTVAYDLMPGFDLARGSGRWINVTAMALAIAVGLGIELLRDRVDRVVPVAVASTGFAVALGLGAVGVLVMPPAAFWLPWVVVAGLVVATLVIGLSRWPAAAVGVLVVIICVELAGAGRSSPIESTTTDTALDAWPAAPGDALAGRPGLTLALTDDAFADPAYLVAGFRPNTNVLAGVRSLDGYDGGVQITERFAELIRRISPAPEIELPLRNNLPIPLTTSAGAELGLRYVLLDDRRDGVTLLPGWVATEAHHEPFTVWENPAWPGDAVLAAVPEAGAGAGAEAAGAGAAAGGGDEHLGAGTEHLGAGTESLPLERRSPTHLMVTVDAEVDSQLVVHRQTAPGWTATIDDQAARLAEGDGFFLTVDVPAGSGVVEFRYRPRWLAAATWASMVGTVGIIAMVAFGASGRRSLRSGGDGADQ